MVNFVIDNLQLVRHADIVLDGVTVIAAPNGFGKSAISKSLAFLASLNRDVSKLVQRRRFRKIIEAIKEVYSKDGVDILVRWYMIDQVPFDWPELFSGSFWADPEKFVFWLKQHFGRSGDSSGYRMGSIYPSTFFESNNYLNHYDQLHSRVNEILNVSDEELSKEEARSALDNAFDREWAPKDHEDVATRLTMSEQNSVSYVELQNKHRNKGINIGARYFSSVFYIEPYHAIDILGIRRNSESQTSPLRVIAENSACAEWPSSGRVAQEDVLARLAKISRGRIEEKSDGLVYREYFSDGINRYVHPTNIASGMKPLAELSRAIEKGAVLPDGLLIIDEPESNLHPEWQVQFAEFLVWFSAKCRVKVVLNTHSPYFLRAIDVSSRKENCEGQCHYYGLVRKRSDYRTETECLDGRIDEIFSEMHRPFARLREERPVEREEPND